MTPILEPKTLKQRHHRCLKRFKMIFYSWSGKKVIGCACLMGLEVFTNYQEKEDAHGV